MAAQCTPAMGRSTSFTEHASNPERQEQASRGNSSNNLLAGVVSLIIFFDAGRSGAAVCTTDLAGWHRTNAIVALGSVGLSFFMIIMQRWDVSGATFWRAIDGSVSGGCGIFLFIWFIIGCNRLFSSQPCDDPASLDAALHCCETNVWYATHGWIMFNFILLGVVLLVCCCSCCCMGPAMMAAAAAQQQEQQQQVGNAGVVQGVPVAVSAVDEATPLKAPSVR